MATKKRAKIAPYPAELKDKLIARANQGESPEAIADEFGGSPSAQTIRNWVNAQRRPAREDTARLRDEVMRLRKVVQNQALNLRALQLLIADSMPELATGKVPAPTSPFDVLGTPTE